jgi:sulfonate transport system substrate-binding protein
MKRRVILILTLILVMIAIFLFINKKENKKTIRIVDLMQATNIHLAIADQKGFFKEEGLDIQLSYEGAGLQAMQKLNSAAVDYAVVVEMNVALRSFDKDDVIILTELSTPINAIKIIGLKSSGIYNPSDLRGKKIGLLQGVNIHKYMTMFLEEHDIKLEEVEIINMSPVEAANAFKSKNIDATILWEPHVYNLTKDEKIMNDITLLTNDGSKYWPYQTVLVTSKDNYNKNPEEVEKILKAVFRADNFIRNNKEESQIILAEMLGLELNDVLVFWDEIEFKIGISDLLVWKMEQEVDWLISTGLKKGEPVHKNFSNCISNKIKYLID